MRNEIWNGRNYAHRTYLTRIRVQTGSFAGTDSLVQLYEDGQRPVGKFELVYQGHVHAPLQGRLLNVCRTEECLDACQSNVQLLRDHIHNLLARVIHVPVDAQVRIIPFPPASPFHRASHSSVPWCNPWCLCRPRNLGMFFLLWMSRLISFNNDYTIIQYTYTITWC